MRYRSLLGILVIFMLLVAGTALAQAYPPYLALGDSIDFGYVTQAGFEYVNPTNFIPYGDYLSSTFHLNEVNAGCPGETSGSMLSATAVDHGCRAFKGYFPLHTAYTSTQMAFAAAYLKAHPATKLVTLQVGANDGFIAQEYCMTQPDFTACMGATLPGVLMNVYVNVGTIIDGIRATGYHGIIIVVNYYSLDYTDPNATYLSTVLNTTLAQVAQAKHVYVADVFTAFQNASMNPFAQGKTCYAGLLNVDPADQTQCDVHPTQSGHRLMAKAIGETYRKALAMQ